MPPAAERCQQSSQTVRRHAWPRLSRDDGVACAAMPLEVLVAGPLLVGLGLRGILLVAGGCYLIATPSMLLNSALREMDAGRGPLHA